jgi:hypothetical protein
MPGRLLYLIACLLIALSAGAQSPSQQVTVDAYLKLTFPGHVTHSDKNGTATFSTTVNHTTYNLVRITHQQEISQTGIGELMDEMARRVMADQLYGGLTKQMIDSTIGGAKGPFIKMKRPDQTRPLFDFIFITIRAKNIYMLMCSSSKPEAKALEDAGHFFEGVVFQM